MFNRFCLFVPEGEAALGFEAEEALRRIQYYGMEGPWVRVFEAKQPLGRLHLIYDYDVLHGRDQIFAAMSGADCITWSEPTMPMLGLFPPAISWRMKRLASTVTGRRILSATCNPTQL